MSTTEVTDNIPVSSNSAEHMSASTQKKLPRNRKLRRRLSAATVIAGGLLTTGALAALLNPHSQTALAENHSSQLVAEGKILYENNCMTCHGQNLEGEKFRGPSLLGVGEASTYFQVNSGRMPASRVESQPLRKPPKFQPRQVEAISAFVQALGGGPTVYRTKDGRIANDEDLTTGNAARGSELYRLNCSSCHNFTGMGGALSGGRFAPPLVPPSGQEIYDAMQTGPQSMPVFSDRQLSPENKKDIITFIKLVTKGAPQGGYGLGGFGPASEGLTMWVLGIGSIVGLAMWMGSRD